jgi:hypothetical protein
MMEYAIVLLAFSVLFLSAVICVLAVFIVRDSDQRGIGREVKRLRASELALRKAVEHYTPK